MLQSDGSKGNPCTCFMFMKPTELAKGLLVEWIQAAEETDAKINQVNPESSEYGSCRSEKG